VSADAEDRGGLFSIILAGVECLEDHFAFDLFESEAHLEAYFSLVSFLDEEAGGQMVDSDDVGVTDEYGPLDDVFEFSYVSGPEVCFECVHTLC